MFQRGGQLEESVCSRRSRVNDALGNALVVEMGDFLAENEVLEQRRPARAAREGILVVRDRRALVGGQRIVGGGGGVMALAACSDRVLGAGILALGLFQAKTWLSWISGWFLGRISRRGCRGARPGRRLRLLLLERGSGQLLSGVVVRILVHGLAGLC